MRPIGSDKMFRVAVCDDDISMAKKICEYINAFGVQREINFKIEEFHDGEELLKSEVSFDIVFLDVEMRVLGGIETAQEIRKRNMSMPIVYITSHPNYWKQAYKVHAFQFISKPFGIENICEVMSDFIDFKRDENIVKVSFAVNDGYIVENANDICYFLFNGRNNVEVTTVYKKYNIKENMAEIYSKLDPSQFYMSNRNCILNLKYVLSLKNNDGIIMQNGEWLPLALKKQKEFYIILSKSLRKM